MFNEVVDYCNGMREQMPISFLLGFFVSGVIGRWFDTYMYIPWLNDITYQITVSFPMTSSNKISHTDHFK